MEGGGGEAVKSAGSLMMAVALLATASLPAFGDEVTGVVRQAGSQTPIANAIVSQQAAGLRTHTAQDGTFVLETTGGSSLVIVGAKKGHFNGFVTVDAPASGVEILLDPVPQTNDPSYWIMEPEFCQMCHPDQYNQWAEIPMANAGTNTWVADMYSGQGTPDGMGGFVYLRDSIHAESNPNAECASCHQPERWIENPFTSLADPTEPTTMAVAHGVSCEVCHKIANVEVSKIDFPGIFPGAVTYSRPAGPAYHQVQYGVLGDTNIWVTFGMRPSYQPQLVAETCGACHQNRSDPEQDHTFTGAPANSTYTEWAESPYGDVKSPKYVSCASCHMWPYGATQVCNYIDLERDSETIRSHDIRGTAPMCLEMAVDLQMTAQRSGNEIEVEIRIDNSKAGHHVPTGAIMRNMILLVEARRSEDDRAFLHTGEQTVHMLGGVGDPSRGYFAGLAGKLYAKVLHDADGNGPTFCTEATGVAFDNRIPALQSDTTSYTFSVPGGDGTAQVSARLIYRRAYRPLVDMKQWTEDGHGNPLEDILPPNFGHLMGSAEHEIALSAGDFDGDGDADLDDCAGFIACVTGPGGGVPAGCSAKDFDADYDVDAFDFAAFQRAFTGVLPLSHGEAGTPREPTPAVRSGG